VIIVDEKKLDNSIIKRLKPFPKALEVFTALITDEEALSLLELGNTVSIKRMGYNDHGRIHTKIATDSALKLYKLLKIKPSLVKEGLGTEDDSITAVVMATFLHDIGMTVNRSNHEMLGVTLAKPIMERILGDHKNKHKIVATACEAILCHMANYKPSSVEAGIVSIADGTDMTAGRARIPHYFFELGGAKIHGYSALSIMHVEIKKGSKKPVAIEVVMSNPAGVFQVEEVLMPKLTNSGLESKVEVIAVIKKGDKKERIPIN
jgi:metal-dependent HD superfamily phosphatase/phosphodiesterase